MRELCASVQFFVVFVVVIFVLSLVTQYPLSSHANILNLSELLYYICFIKIFSTSRYKTEKRLLICNMEAERKKAFTNMHDDGDQWGQLRQFPVIKANEFLIS